MTVIRRLFGYAEDTKNGGSGFDDLTSGAIPDATVFWPVTGGSLDRNIERTDRNTEVRGRRAATAPAPFTAAPQMTIPVNAYLSVVAVALRKCFGGVDAGGTGTAPGPFVHNLVPLGFGATYLPAVHLQMVRDDLNHKVSGAVFSQVQLNFPMDGMGTIEITAPGQYYKNDPAAPPTSSFTGLSDEPLFLRDAAVTIDGAAEAIPDLQAFEFGFNNNTTVKRYARRNVVSQSIGTPAKLRKVWYPSENKLGPSQDVTYAINTGNTEAGQELALDFGQVQQLAFNCLGADIPAASATEMLDIVLQAAEHTTGGAGDLSARDDITSRFEGGAFYNETAGADITVTVTNGSAAPIV
jgi:hypothetical protein